MLTYLIITFIVLVIITALHLIQRKPKDGKKLNIPINDPKHKKWKQALIDFSNEEIQHTKPHK